VASSAQYLENETFLYVRLQALASYSAVESDVRKQVSSQRSLAIQQKQWDKEMTETETKISEATQNAKADEDVRC
jgi:23S rRNA maturation mini-RNase III